MNVDEDTGDPEDGCGSGDDQGQTEIDSFLSWNKEK